MHNAIYKNFNNECKNKIEDKDVKICSRLNDTVSDKIDFTDYGVHRDHPAAWGLKVRYFYLRFLGNPRP